ncbi:MAG: hypothetical protein KTR27_11870 [Leptolyngbyaceae cyanobacterium MAG.088]|nr:hypothetical protein [Leptolyngbyaceae cyanobacterium MAG.088]
MNSNKNALWLEHNNQNDGHSASSSESQQEQDNTISLVFPDGRVTKVYRDEQGVNDKGYRKK